ncbi:hypothetical protein [Geobacter sp.]|uniref:hypothetical protein n=1 Tax=Geobacter sp. TaxID=46610 RepID=UPI0027B8F391|nr:hypothetical protein [Geobacter sp.]
MLTSEIMDFINEAEELFPVDKWEVDSLKIWPFIRIHLNFSIYAHHHVKVATRPGRNKYFAAAIDILRDLHQFAYATYKDKKKCARLKQADALFYSDGVSFASVDGSWYEKFCDPLISVLSDEGLSSLLITPSTSYLIPRKTSSKFVQPGLNLAKIKGFLRSKFKSSLHCELPQFQNFINYVDGKNLGISVPSAEKLIQLVFSIKQYILYYNKILDKVRPKIAAIVSYYSIEGMAFCLACRGNNIPCFDLQHGLQGPLHVAYGRWNKLPQNGYGMLPSLFWCWRDADAAAIEQWSYTVESHHRPIVGGNPWLNLWLESTSEMVRRYDDVIHKAGAMYWDKKKILVTLQFGIDDKEKLKPILEAIATADPSYFWWIRLHPCMLDKRKLIHDIFINCGNLNIDITVATDLPLFALLRHTDVHVTHSSSTVIEAESFGVPSVITSDYGAEFFKEQVASGWAVLVSDKVSVNQLVYHLLQHKPKQSMDDTYFISPATEYMLELASNKLNITPANKQSN